MNNYDYTGMHINNLDMLVKEKANIVFDEMMLAIRCYTSNSVIKKMDARSNGYKVIKVKKGLYKISKGERSYEFSKASELIKIKDFLKNLKKDLLLNNYQKRMNNCHEISLNYHKIAPYLITGFVDSADDEHRIIHTWLETDKSVIDLSHNLVMDINDYYELLNVEVLNVIKGFDIDYDVQRHILDKFPMSTKLYCLFRDDVMYDLDKNKEAFEKPFVLK